MEVPMFSIPVTAGQALGRGHGRGVTYGRGPGLGMVVGEGVGLPLGAGDGDPVPTPGPGTVGGVTGVLMIPTSEAGGVANA